jgi:formate dehydrogenase subunit gamma
VTQFSAWDAQTARSCIAELKSKPGALLPILHALQERFGYVDKECVPIIADELNLSRAEVHGVISFYHHFRTTKPGRYTIQICRAEACQSMGADALVSHVKAHLGIDFHETTADGKFSLEPVYCLGNCACSPALMVNDEPYGCVSEQRFDGIVAELSEVA